MVARAHAETHTCTYVKMIFSNPSQSVELDLWGKKNPQISFLYILSVCLGVLEFSSANMVKHPCVTRDGPFSSLYGVVVVVAGRNMEPDVPGEM